MKPLLYKKGDKVIADVMGYTKPESFTIIEVDTVYWHFPYLIKAELDGLEFWVSRDKIISLADATDCTPIYK